MSPNTALALALAPQRRVAERRRRPQYRVMSRTESPEPKDLEVLMRAVAERGDRAAFATLFEAVGPRVKAFLIRGGAVPAVAEDVAQDVMMTVWRRAAMFDPAKASLMTWVFTVARNRRIDLIRKEKRPELDGEDPALRPPETPRADDVADAGQRAERIRAAMAELPAKQTQVLKLAFFAGKPHTEVAAELDLPLGTVKSRIRLALAKLRERIEDLDHA